MDDDKVRQIENDLNRLVGKLDQMESGRLRNYEQEIVDVFSRISSLEARINGMKDGVQKESLKEQVEELVEDYGLTLFE